MRQLEAGHPPVSAKTLKQKTGASGGQAMKKLQTAPAKIPRRGQPALATRAFGWLMLAVLAAFLLKQCFWWWDFGLPASSGHFR